MAETVALLSRQRRCVGEPAPSLHLQQPAHFCAGIAVRGVENI
jgi:hypothetical protein